MNAAERAAAREAELAKQLESMRRIGRPEEYVWDMTQEAFWDLETGLLLGAKAVDGAIPIERWRAIEIRGREQLIPPSKDILRIEANQTVETSTWWPGQDTIISDWLVTAEGVRKSKGARMYNQYVAPQLSDEGDATKAGVWIDHVKTLWPDPKEHEYFFDYCAHMIQKPAEKCNAAIILSGTQGIGKDATLVPIKAAVGDWNYKSIDPDELFSSYKPWLQCLMLVIDEVRPSKDDFHASSMYNVLKPITAAPPNVLPLNQKYQAMRYIMNVLRTFITTNDWMAMYVPAEDRRLFVMHSAVAANWAGQDYFETLFKWFEADGIAHVAAWLRARDLTAFNPKAPVHKTQGWQAIAGTWGRPDDAISAALENLKDPDVVFGTELINAVFDDQEEIRGMLKSMRKICHRMLKNGYVHVENPAGGRWKFGKQCSRTAFVKQEFIADAIPKIKAHIEELEK